MLKSEAAVGWQFSIQNFEMMGESILPSEDSNAWSAALSLTIPGVGFPEDLYTEASQKLEKKGAICGLMTGNSCHFVSKCADVLKYVDTETLSVTFFDLNSDSVVLPLAALMR